MPLMKPVFNINGTNKAAMVDDRRAVMAQLDSAMKALQEIKPHARDYQTLPFGEASTRYAADIDIYRNRFALLDSMRNEIMDEAVSFLNS